MEGTEAEEGTTVFCPVMRIGASHKYRNSSKPEYGRKKKLRCHRQKPMGENGTKSDTDRFCN